MNREKEDVGVNNMRSGKVWACFQLSNYFPYFSLPVALHLLLDIFSMMLLPFSMWYFIGFELTCPFGALRGIGSLNLFLII